MREIPISESDSTEQIVHLLSEAEDWAIQAALAANRPLLCRGEPGIGKTQLAYAASRDLKRPLVTLTVDAHTESRDLLWTFDAVQRLAEAQVLSNIYRDVKSLEELKAEVAVSKFVRPGPIWWALNWGSAQKQLGDKGEPPEIPDGCSPANGVVLLIDEIDKASSDLPNGLLEAFGMRQFTPQGSTKPIMAKPGTPAPLVIVTTNEERILPDAFIRRCFVLNLELPDARHEGNHDAFVNYLVLRGEAHFGEGKAELLKQVAELLWEDRRNAMENRLSPLPGQAEYLDFLRAIINLEKEKKRDPAAVIEKVQSFVFQKARGFDS